MTTRWDDNSTSYNMFSQHVVCRQIVHATKNPLFLLCVPHESAPDGRDSQPKNFGRLYHPQGRAHRAMVLIAPLGGAMKRSQYNYDWQNQKFFVRLPAFF